MQDDITRAPTLTPGQQRHLLRVTAATSRHPERDCLILLLGHATGMRISEIAQVTPAHLMHPSGNWRTEASLTASITKGCKQRCIYLTIRKLIAALDAYVAYRQANDMATTGEPAYRGLRPHLPLIINRRGCSYSMNTKRRTLSTGERRDYRASDTLQRQVTELYRRAGIKGSSHSGRRTMATRALAQSGDFEAVAILLGHVSIDVTARYVDIDKGRLRQAFADVI
jgi:site-specific recombinase XerD